MSGTKILIVVLVLIAVLFVVVVVWGAGINGKPTSDWHVFKPDSHAAIGSLGNFFGPPGPTLKASELTPDPPPLKLLHSRANAAGKFILSAGDQPTKFDIAADSKDQFRQATFTVTRRDCATLEYWTADGSGGKLKNQNWPNDGEDHPKDPTKAKFQILSARGFLRVTLTSDCTVQLE